MLYGYLVTLDAAFDPQHIAEIVGFPAAEILQEWGALAAEAQKLGEADMDVQERQSDAISW